MSVRRTGARAALSGVIAGLVIGVTACGIGTPAAGPSSGAPSAVEQATAQGGVDDGRAHSVASEDEDHDVDVDVDVDVHENELPLTPEPLPTWDDQSRAEAASAAGTAVTAYGRPSDAATWWHDLSPLLSAAAQQAYVGTDPANVPTAVVTDEGVVAPDSRSPFLAEVDVPTDLGTFKVLLVRTGAGRPWLVERFLLPVSDAAAP